ncbi:MAG: glycerophosphodiester phosphodiesterase family protein [Flavobacteriaceae bacterium]
MSCQTKQNIDVQGHRGCRGLIPENSLQAFEKAIDLGVHTLELDLAISKDKQVVVSHEPFISRLYCLDASSNVIPKSDDKKYNLYQMDYAEIKAFDCGTKFHPNFPEQEKFKVYKPLLKEVFEVALAKNPKIKFNIEFKAKPEYDDVFTPEPDEFVNLVLNLVKEYNVEDQVNLQSFDLRILETTHKQNPNIKLALLVDENETIETKLKAMSFKPQIISPYFKLLDAAKVKNYQKENFQIIPWTVNEVEDMNKMIKYRVDGIITDYPNVLIRLLKE